MLCAARASVAFATAPFLFLYYILCAGMVKIYYILCLLSVLPNSFTKFWRDIISIFRKAHLEKPQDIVYAVNSVLCVIRVRCGG